MLTFFSLARVSMPNAALFSTRRPGFWAAAAAGALAWGFTGVTLGCYFLMPGRQQATSGAAPQIVNIHYVYASRPLPEKTRPDPFIATPDDRPAPELQQAMPDFPQQSAEDPEESAYRQQLYESVAKALKARAAL